jgi:hypothetical protein
LASASGSGTTPAKAFDGDLNTRWTTGAPQVPGQFFQLDLGSLQVFSQITLNAQTTSDFPRGFEVDVSTDGTTWTTSVATGSGSSSLTTIVFPAQTARFIKIIQTSHDTHWWSIFEINVYDTVSTSSFLSRSGWKATASNTCQTDVPAHALDGNSSTRWSTGLNQAPGQWFQVDMLSPRTFNSVVLDAATSNGDYPRALAVYLSNDGATWGSPVASTTGTTQVVAAKFYSQTARFIRLVLAATSSTNWWSIHELNVGLSTNVTPSFHCIVKHSSTAYTAFFGYVNNEATAVTIPVGSGNLVTPVPAHAQPAKFEVGAQLDAVAVDATSAQSASWQLAGHTATASIASAVCPGSTPTPVTCAGVPSTTAAGCALVVRVPNVTGPNRDSASLNRPANPATVPAGSVDSDFENEAAILQTQFAPTTVLSIAAGATQTISIPVPASSTVFTRALWHVTGTIATTLQSGSTTVTGSVVTLGERGGVATAMSIFPTGTVTFSISNTGSTMVVVQVDTGVLPMSETL